MSWVEAFDAGGIDLTNPGVADYVRGSIISWGVGQGMSNDAIQRELINARVGISVKQQDPFIAAERVRQGASLSSTQLDINYSSGELVAPEPPVNWTGQYVHQVTFQYRDPNSADPYALHEHTVGVKSTLPLSPYDAINAGYNVLSINNPDSPTIPDNAKVMVSQLTGMWYDTQGRRLPSVDAGIGAA